MALSFVQYVANGATTQFAVTFPYLTKSHVKVYINGTEDTSKTWVSSTIVQTSTTPANGAVVEVRRTTPNSTPQVDFSDSSTLTASDLDTATTQFLYLSQEAQDTADTSMRLASDGTFDAGTRRIKNVVNPVNAQDVATKSSTEAYGAATIAAAAAAAEAAAAASVATAASLAGNAASSASAAATSATNASTSATNAAASATSASASATAATTNGAAQVTLATTQAANAAASATAAAGSATTASTQAANAAASATAAAASAGSVNLASPAAIGSTTPNTGAFTTLSASGLMSLTSEASLQSIIEKVTISATAATGTIAFDVKTQPALYYTTNAAANWTLNVRGNSGVSLNTLLATGQAVTIAFLVTQGGTPYYCSTFQVDGSTITPKWVGQPAPTGGTASGIDVYRYTILKTGNAAFTVFATLAAAA